MTWQDRAACRGVPKEVFFPQRRGQDDWWRQARDICAACPVQVQCLSFHLQFPAMAQYGFQGGQTPEERRRTILGDRPPTEPGKGRGRPMGRFNRGSIRDKLVDLLESDPDQWWSSAELMERFGCNANALHAAIGRLRPRVESRDIPDGQGPNRWANQGPVRMKQYRWAAALEEAS